jgi:hypothetical protein
MHEGNPTRFETTAQVRMTRQERRDLDDWRRQQQDIPTRPEAIRVAIRRLVAPRAGELASSAPEPATETPRSEDRVGDIRAIARGKAVPA